MNRENELKKIITIEQVQSSVTGYISKPGKWFLYSLPVLLVIITFLALLNIVSIGALSIVFYSVLLLYGLNAIIIFIGARLTKKSLKMRLKYERKRGRPIDSLDGFELLSANVLRELRLLHIIAIICMVSLIFFILMLLTTLLKF